MRCTLCGHSLSFLTAVLAQTRIGTQCPDCWTILRCVHGNCAFPRKREATVKRGRLRFVQYGVDAWRGPERREVAIGEFHGMSGGARKHLVRQEDISGYK
jgi:hypothetical protein